MSIHNLSGKKLKTWDVGKSNRIVGSGANLIRGIYFVSITMKKTIFTKKVVIQ